MKLVEVDGWNHVGATVCPGSHMEEQGEKSDSVPTNTTIRCLDFFLLSFFTCYGCKLYPKRPTQEPSSSIITWT